jgi:hypothetical protein
VSGSRTVVPGPWYGVLGESVMVLLPPEAKARVAALWETVDDGAGFDEVLDAVISGGLRGLPGFVLVSGEGRDVKVVIRGAGEAALETPDGPVTVSGSAETTWVEQNVSGVTALRVRVADGDGAPYAVGPGLVRVASVEHPAVPAPAAAGAALPEAEARAVAVSAPLEPSAQTPVGPPATPAAERPARILPPDPQLEAERASAPVPEPPVPVPPVPGAGTGPLTGRDLGVAPRHADRDPGDVRAVGPRTGAADEQPAHAANASVARLVFSSGEVVDVDRAVVIGRAPDHGRFHGDDQTRLVTVPSPHQEISSTHLEIRPGTGADQGSAVATDLGSTNGTVVVQPGLPAEDLRPGIAVQLLPGATIDLGEGVTIQVTTE